MIKYIILFLIKKLCLIFVFTCSLNSFSQNFEIAELNKVANNSPDNLYTDIAAFSDGTLFYSIKNNIVQHYGNFQKLHDFSEIHLKSIFRSTINIITYKDKYVFFSTQEGVFSLNTENNFRKKLIHAENLNPKTPFNFSFTIDEDGDLWVISSDFYLFKIRNNTIVKKIKLNFSLKQVTLYGYKFKIIKKSSLVYLNFRNQIFLINEKEAKATKIYKSNYKGFKRTVVIKPNLPNINISNKNRDDYVFDLKESIKSALVSLDGSNVYDLSKFNFTVKSKKIHYLSFLKNELFFYGLNLDKNGEQNIDLVHKERIDFQVKHIAIANNKIYICNKQNKIFVLKNKELGFFSHQFYPRSSLRGIVSDKNRNIYAVLENQIGQIIKVDTLGKETLFIDNARKGFNTQNIGLYRLEIENDSLLWAYTQEFNIVKHNLYTNKTQFIKFPDKIAPFSRKYRGLMNSFVKLNDNEVLFFLRNTFYSFNKSDNSFSKYLTTNLKGIVANEMLRKDGFIWIGTRTNGLYYIDEKTGDVAHYHPNSKTNKISSRFIFDLHFKANGDLMIGSAEGLDVLNTQTGEVINYSIKDGLPDNRVITIEEVADSYWMGTFNGLVRMDKKTSNFLSFFTEHGLPDNEFNKVSSFKLNDDFLVFGGMNGFVNFNPSELIKNIIKPNLRLINLRYFDYKKDSIINKKYNLEDIKNLNLGYDKNFITFNFSDGIHNDILYQIDDSKWFLSEKGEINLLGLKDGNHLLNIKSKGFSSKTLSYEIFVNKIFYKKNWFQMFIFLIIISFIFLFYSLIAQKNRLKRIKNKQIRQLEDIALRNQMNPHFLFNCINNIQSVFLLEGEVSVNKYFTNLSDLLRFTIDNNGQKTVTLENEINYLKAYINLECLREGSTFDFQISSHPAINTLTTLIPPMLFQPLVENAIQHGLMPKVKDKLLIVNFNLEGNYLIGSITDNGVGLQLSKIAGTKEKYESYGNTILRKRIALYNNFKKDYIHFSFYKNKDNNGFTSVIKILISQ